MPEAMLNVSQDATPIGITVDNLSLRQTIEKIGEFIGARDGKPRLISTLNVDFMVNTFGFGGRSTVHRELLSTLRNSDIVTADGFPVLWLSSLVGTSLKERVCGSDLVPALAREAAKAGHSIFLLGGGNGVAARAAGILKADNPNLVIAGTAAPMIATTGGAAIQSMQEDAELVEQINASGADILLIGMGNPKQEIWFNRNRHQLKVPVSIGVGGTFEFITGGVKRAPRWLQRLNLEWLFRITQDPARLWHRYARGLAFLGLYGVRLAASRAYEHLLIRQTRNESADISCELVSASNSSIAVTTMPKNVTESTVQSLLKSVQNLQDHTALILDFSVTRRISLAAQSLLTSRKSDLMRHAICAGMSRRLKTQFARTFTDDLLNHTPERVMDHLASVSTPADSISCVPHYRTRHGGLWFLRGTVDVSAANQLFDALSQLGDEVGGTLVLDLRRAMHIETAALLPLTRLHKALADKGCLLLLGGLSPSDRQLAESAGLSTVAADEGDTSALAALMDEGQIHA